MVKLTFKKVRSYSDNDPEKGFKISNSEFKAYYFSVNPKTVFTIYS